MRQSRRAVPKMRCWWLALRMCEGKYVQCCMDLCTATVVGRMCSTVLYMLCVESTLCTYMP